MDRREAVGELLYRRRQERRQWLAGTVLMAVWPLKFAVAALLAPPVAPIQSAVLTAPAWMAQILTPIDQSMRSSGPLVLPALVALVLLLRLWVNYGRGLFKPLPVAAVPAQD